MFLRTLVLGLVLTLSVRAGEDPVSTITQDGKGEAYAVPDEGYLVGGVKTFATTVTEATQSNAQTMQEVVSGLRALGVEANDIRTIRFEIDDHYRQGNDRTVKDGYQVSNLMRVRVRKIQDMGSILDLAVSSGANHIEGIRLGNSDSEGLTDRARSEAVDVATRRARLIAKGLGCRLGRVIFARESSSVPRPYFPDVSYGTARTDTTSTPISGGSLVYSAQVSVQWELVSNDDKVTQVKP